MTFPLEDLLTKQPKHLLGRYSKHGVTRLTVGAVLCRRVGAEVAILVLRRVATDDYGGIEELPSGALEAGETLGQALAREVLEETGLTIPRVGPFLFDFVYKSRNGITAQLNFLVPLTGEPAVRVDQAEHESFRWLSERNLANSRLSPNVRRELERALSAKANQW